MSVSAHEQMMLELLNRLRLDAHTEVARLGITDPEVIDALNLPTGSLMALAGNSALHEAAALHSEWILDEDTLSHIGADGSTAYDRMVDAGYDFSGFWTWGENTGYRASTGELDPTSAVTNIFLGFLNSAGHLSNMLNADFSEVGIGQEFGDFWGYDATTITQNFATSNYQFFLTGVSYNDLDNDGFYSVGEGVGGVVFSFGGTSESTHSAGGYSAEITEASPTRVTISQPGEADINVRVFFDSENFKLDLVDGDTLLSSGTLDLRLGAVNATLLGTRDANLWGNESDNVLTGNIGDNTLFGGNGDDTIIGGEGYDTAIFSASFEDIDVSYEDGTVVISSDQGTDRLEGVEAFSFDGTVVSLGDLLDGMQQDETPGIFVVSCWDDAETQKMFVSEAEQFSSRQLALAYNVEDQFVFVNAAPEETRSEFDWAQESLSAARAHILEDTTELATASRDSFHEVEPLLIFEHSAFNEVV